MSSYVSDKIYFDKKYTKYKKIFLEKLSHRRLGQHVFFCCLVERAFLSLFHFLAVELHLQHGDFFRLLEVLFSENVQLLPRLMLLFQKVAQVVDLLFMILVPHHFRDLPVELGELTFRCFIPLLKKLLFHLV